MSLLFWHTDLREYFWLSGEKIFQFKEYWRLFTGFMIHSSIGHLLSNGFLFVVFGWFLRAYFGFWVFPVGVFLLGALTNLVTIWFYDPKVMLLGASGVVYAMVALWVTLYIFYERKKSLPRKLFLSLGFLLVLMFPTNFSPKTSYLAHGVGFLMGVGGGLLMILGQLFTSRK